MKDLIAALAILQKYTDAYAPTGCSHDELRVYVTPSEVSDDDVEELDRLGFIADAHTDSFLSFRFGSA